MSKYSGKSKGKSKPNSKDYGSAGSTSYLSKFISAISKYSPKKVLDLYKNLDNPIKSLYTNLNANLKNYLGNKSLEYSYAPISKYGGMGDLVKAIKLYEERRCPRCGSLMISGICPKCASYR